MLYYCREHTSVHRVKPQLVHVKASERSVGNALVDFSVAQHEREVAHTLQKPVGDPGGSTAPGGDLQRSVFRNGQAQYARTAPDNPGKLLRRIQLQLENHAEPIPQGCGQLTGSGGGADQGELRQLHPEASGGRPLPDDDVHLKILHGGI